MTVRVKAVVVSALERMRRTPPWRIDAVLATCFVVTGLTTTSQTSAVYEPRDGVAIGLILAATLPYYARRLAPVPVFAVSLAAVAALFVQGYAAGALPMVIAVGAYTVGAYRPLRDVVLAAALMYTAFVVMLVADSPDFGGAEFVTSVAVFGATMLVGWTMQARRLRLDAMEREQGEAALRAAADERLRIAQELHDVVAHSLGVIAVQAGVGMHVIDTDPAEARRALEHISRTSRSSLGEIRRLLGLVRSGEPTVTYTPTPGLADLPRLALEVADAGLPVDLDVADNTGYLPPGVELAAYRIVQEALMNVSRHARASACTVRLACAEGRALTIEVTDDGVGLPETPGGGVGLSSMRERAAELGGECEIVRSWPSGTRVFARLPFREPLPEGRKEE